MTYGRVGNGMARQGRAWHGMTLSPPSTTATNFSKEKGVVGWGRGLFLRFEHMRVSSNEKKGGYLLAELALNIYHTMFMDFTGLYVELGVA